MEVVDTRERRVLAEARGFVRGEALALLVNVAVVGLLVWLVLQGVQERFGVPAVAVWLLAGVVVGDAWDAARSVWSGWRELRRLQHSPGYVAAVAELDDAYERAQRTAGGGR